MNGLFSDTADGSDVPPRSRRIQIQYYGITERHRLLVMGRDAVPETWDSVGQLNCGSPLEKEAEHYSMQFSYDIAKSYQD